MQRILIIDDNPTNLKLACSVLEMEGYSITSAVDAEDAMGLVSKHTFDLILTDIELPGMDGLTLARTLKASPATGKIPIIAITAFAMKGDDTKALEAGCDGYITKPIDTRKLGRQIAEVLGQKRAGSGAM